MKRIMALLLLIVMLAGCGPKTEKPALEEDLIVVGISQVGAESDWRVANSESMKSTFTEENGYRLLFEDARQQQDNQIMAIRKFIQQKVDYIILMPITEFGWESVLQEARDAGIPVILVDRMVNVEDEDLFVAHVGSDLFEEGRKAVAWMEKRYAKRNELNIIHIMGTLGSTAQIGRTQALEAAVAEHEEWNLLAQLDGDFTQAKTYEVLLRCLQELPEDQSPDVVYCENDNEAFGAIQALEEMGYICGKDVDVISFDATRNCLKLCMEGKISLAVECNPLQGPLAAEIIETLEAGQMPEKYHYIEETAFTFADLSEKLIASRNY